MQISQKVHALRFPFFVPGPSGIPTERYVYVYLIYGSEVCLIDSGVASSEEAIFDYVRKTDRKVSDISLIIQTHSHPDHIGSTRAIKAETGCSVAAHHSERSWIENIDLQAKERPVPGFRSLAGGSVAVDRLLDEGDIVDLGCGLKLRVYHTPGHSKGSLSLLLQGFNILFSGDAVPVPGDMPIYEDAMASVQSLRKLKGIPDIRYLLASWDEPRKGAEAYERIDAGLQYLQRIHEAVLRVSGNNPAPEPIELCAKVMKELGMSSENANPLVARSFASHLVLRERSKLL